MVLSIHLKLLLFQWIEVVFKGQEHLRALIMNALGHTKSIF